MKIERKRETFRVGKIGVFADLSSCHLSFFNALCSPITLYISPLGCGLANYTKEANKFENSDCVFFGFSAL